MTRNGQSRAKRHLPDTPSRPIQQNPNAIALAALGANTLVMTRPGRTQPEREPERRHVGVDARVQVDGVAYDVDPSLAGETVTLWWGLFDHELFVEHED